MAATSAGILLYRRDSDGLRVLLVHPGGPYWQSRDDGAWSIPKGEVNPDETPEAAARRDFFEELGTTAEGHLEELGDVRQKGGKRVVAFALEGDLDAAGAMSVTFEMEWPPKSGRLRSFPEVDRACWFTLADARRKLLSGQVPLLDRLEARPAGGPG